MTYPSTKPFVFCKRAYIGTVARPYKTPRFMDAINLAPKAKRPNPLTTGFTVECIGEGLHCDMKLEGDTQEFVMGNFTITQA